MNPLIPTLLDRSSEETARVLSDSDTEAVLVVDGNTSFVREPLRSDFFSEGKARIFLSEEAEARSDPDHAEVERISSWTNRALALLGGLRQTRLVCRGPILVVPDHWRRLEQHLRAEHGWTWTEAMVEVPDVGCWYSAWMQVDALESVVVTEPVFRVIRTRGEVVSARLAGLTAVDLARGYLGVVADASTVAFLAGSPDVDTARVLSDFVDASDLAHAALLRPYNRMPRVQRAVQRLRGRNAGR